MISLLTHWWETKRLWQVSPLILFILLIQLGCISVPRQHNGPAPGRWRGTFILEDSREIIVTKGKDKIVTRDSDPESLKKVIPCTFEILYREDGSMIIDFINGDERIRFDQIQHGYDQRSGNDTIEIRLDPYDAIIKGIWEHSKIAGDFIVLDKNQYSIPFTAQYGQDYRFKKIPDTARVDLSGSWEVVFDKDSSDSFRAIGEFKQNNNHLTGTFRTETGDFRYLEGQVSGHSMKLSSFDGAHAYLFDAQVMGDSLYGKFYSGNKYKATFEAKRSVQNNLRAGMEIVSILSDKPVTFSLPNSEGQMVNLEEAAYQNKIKILQIMGSWCPNCRDEVEFLKSFQKQNPDPKIALIGLAFERHKDKNKAIDRIKAYKTKLDIPYEVLWGGYAHKDSASALFPQIDGIKSYPTLIFLDSRNRIKKVHSGFDGPATSEFGNFQKEFQQIISELKEQEK